MCLTLLVLSFIDVSYCGIGDGFYGANRFSKPEVSFAHVATCPTYANEVDPLLEDRDKFLSQGSDTFLLGPTTMCSATMCSATNDSGTLTLVLVALHMFCHRHNMTCDKNQRIALLIIIITITRNSSR